MVFRSIALWRDRGSRPSARVRLRSKRPPSLGAARLLRGPPRADGASARSARSLAAGAASDSWRQCGGRVAGRPTPAGEARRGKPRRRRPGGASSAASPASTGCESRSSAESAQSDADDTGPALSPAGAPRPRLSTSSRSAPRDGGGPYGAGARAFSFRPSSACGRGTRACSRASGCADDMSASPWQSIFRDLRTSVPAGSGPGPRTHTRPPAKQVSIFRRQG